jgi:hypothetical protein
MAVPKHTRASGCETNPFFLEIFRDHSDSDERERLWHTAMIHAGEGSLPLRFPVYETLYLINLHAQKLVDLLCEMTDRFGIDTESLDYHQSLIQLVRAGASQSIAAFMNDIELTDDWLFDRLRVKEEKDLRDPDDVYISVREREKQRSSQGLPPRIQFLDQEQEDANVTARDSSGSED